MSKSFYMLVTRDSKLEKTLKSTNSAIDTPGNEFFKYTHYKTKCINKMHTSGFDRATTAQTSKF